MALKIYDLQLNLYNEDFFSGTKILLSEKKEDTKLDNKVYIYTFNSDTQDDSNKHDIIKTITNKEIIFPVSKSSYRDIYFNKDILNKINASKLLKNFNQVESDRNLSAERFESVKLYINDNLEKLKEKLKENQIQDISKVLNDEENKTIAQIKAKLNTIFNIVKLDQKYLRDLNKHIFNTEQQEYFNMFLETEDNKNKDNEFNDNIFLPISENKNIERYSNSTVKNYNDDSTLQNIISKNLEFVCDNPKSNKDNDKYNAVLYYNIFSILNQYYITSDSIFLYKKRIFTVKNIESIKYNNKV